MSSKTEVNPVFHDPVSSLSILHVSGPNVNTYSTPPKDLTSITEGCYTATESFY